MGKKAEHANKKIPDVSGLVTTTVLNLNIGSLYKKNTDYVAKLSEIKKKKLKHDYNNKYVTTKKFNRLLAENYTASLKQANLATKSDIDDFVEKTGFDDKLRNLNKKVTSNKKKQVEIKKKLTDRTKKLHKYQKKDILFCQVRCILKAVLPKFLAL